MTTKLKYLINNIFIDVDGTLTDGKYLISSKGEQTKSFYTRDFEMMEIFMQCSKDNKISFITGSDGTCLQRKIENLVYHNDAWNEFYSNDQIKLLTSIHKKHVEIQSTFCRIVLEESAYIGDSYNDIEAMKMVKLAGCPKNAVEEIVKNSLFVSELDGGEGAVADFINFIVKENLND